MRIPDFGLIDNEWNFIHAEYSYETSSALMYIYFNSIDTSQVLRMDNVEKRFPLGALNFRLGGCAPNSRNIYQGLYKNVQFAYGAHNQGGNLRTQ